MEKEIMDAIPLEILFPATIILVVIAIEVGYKVGISHPSKSREVKEKVTSNNLAAIMAMLGFILVFTFGIVYARYDTKKELVRTEANMIHTAWLRSDFLPDMDNQEAEKLLKRYVDLRLNVAEALDMDLLKTALAESNQIQKQLWNMAVANARKDMNSDVAALYIESLNEMFNQQALRVAIAVQLRIPDFMWLLLYILVFLAMFSVGYHSAISGSDKRSWATPIMVLSFSLVIILIASLDRPQSRFVSVTQQPLIDLKTMMESRSDK